MSPPVTFVVTRGETSLDLYSEKLGKRLPVPKLRIETDAVSIDAWRAPWGTRLRTTVGDARLLRALRARDGVLHLPSHHFGRYGTCLARPYAITVHDLMRYRDLSRGTPFIDRLDAWDGFHVRLDAAGIRKAAAIVAVSETTKLDLVRRLGVPESRVAVVYEGVDHDVFRPVAARPLAGRYVLYVGSEQPRKDLRTLVRALARVKEDARFSDLKLVKIGGPGGDGRSFRAATVIAAREAGIEDDCIFTGRVAEDELPAYYSGAECFVLPSLYEGFGLPPLEAMACGCPVVVSDGGALPEIGGEAAAVFRAGDEQALTAVLTGVLGDEARRADLRERGLARAAQFSWERAAQETLAVYERLV